MPKVCVRDLKNNLSRYLKRVQGGEEIIVTERGRSVARIVPAEPHNLKRLLDPLIREGALKWNGGKPRGAHKRPTLRGAPLVETVVEHRR